jgi:SCY1-like protein 1
VFDNPYVKMQLFLDEAMTKPAEERILFLQSLGDLLNRGVVDERAAVYKLLPLLIMILKTNAGNDHAMSQEVNRRQVLAVVPLLFQVAEMYLTKKGEGDSKESPFQVHIVPLIPSLFGINDRGVRGAILQKITLLESQLDDRTLNSQVFDPMCSGFTDTSGPLRELTLKSTIVLVPKLNAASLEKLVRYLVRLQSDPEASIRTNTIIFVGKVAPSLSETSRQKLILPAFTRAMKDPFTPCRLAALKAVTTCKSYFSQKDVSEKVLPCIVPFLLDASKDVRTEAFKVVDMFLVGLREESGKMGDGGEGGQGAASAGGAAPTSGGYLSGFSSWMSTSADPAAAAPTTTTTKPAAPASTASNGSGATTSNPNAPKFSSLSLSDAQIGGAKMHANSSPGGWDDGDDGWGDDDLGSGGSKTKTDDDDFFASFDSSKATKTIGGVGLSASRPAPKLNQSSGLKVKKAPKPAVKKLSAKNDPLDDGWDDF